MARRIDIELTSARSDGSWTWRAAGALQPRGALDGSLLPSGAKAGDVLRAEADFEIEGIVINSVLAPKEKKRSEPARIELIAPSAPVGGVTTQLFGRAERGPSDRRRPRSDEGRPSERGRGGPDRARRDRPERTDRSARPDRGDQSGRTERPAGAESSASPPTSPGQEGNSTGAGRRRPAERGRPSTPAGSRPDDRGRPSTSAGPRRDERTPRRSPRPEPGDRPRTRRESGAPASSAAERGPRSAPRRLNPANTHRQAVLASLPPEQQPVAEQVLRGGIPAVRTAIHLEREKALAEGRSAPNTEALLALAEGLRPRLREAEWRDRAEAAVKVADSVALRDLRSVVTGADLARSDESRQLAVTLRETLELRLKAQHDEWVTEIDHQLDEGRVVRALRASARPPEPTTRLSAEQATRLSDAASAAMSPSAAPDLWAALLEAVAASPVRRSVKPTGLPDQPGPALLSAAHQQAGRIPALAGLLGISIPPPPGPTRAPGSGQPAPTRRARPPRPPRSARPATPPASDQATTGGSAPVPPAAGPAEDAAPASSLPDTAPPELAPESAPTVPEQTAAPAPPTVPEQTAAPASPTVPEQTAAPASSTVPDQTAAPASSTVPDQTAAPASSTVPDQTAAPTESAPTVGGESAVGAEPAVQAEAAAGEAAVEASEATQRQPEVTGDELLAASADPGEASPRPETATTQVEGASPDPEATTSASDEVDAAH